MAAAVASTRFGYIILSIRETSTPESPIDHEIFPGTLKIEINLEFIQPKPLSSAKHLGDDTTHLQLSISQPLSVHLREHE